MKTLSLVALLLILNAAAAFAQRDDSKVELKAVPVAGHIHMREGVGDGAGFIKTDRWIETIYHAAAKKP